MNRQRTRPKPKIPPERKPTPRIVRLLLGGVLFVLIGLAVASVGAYLWAGHHYRAAQAALGRRDFAGAHRHLVQALQVWSGSSETQFQAARAARRAGLYDEADAHLRASQRLGWVPELVELECVMLRVQRGELDHGEDVLKTTAGSGIGDSDRALILEALTKGYLQTYRLHDARDCLNTWLELEPDNVQALLWRGWVQEAGRDFAKALDDYRRAVALEPENDEARLRLGEELLEVKQFDQAQEHFDRLHAGKPDQPAGVLGLALCRANLGRPAEARALLDQLIGDPRFAVVLPLCRRGAEARPAPDADTQRWWQQTTAEAPYHQRQPDYLRTLYVRALTERGKLALQERQAAEAEALLRRAVNLAPHEHAANYWLQQCLEKAGKSAEAAQYLARCKQLEDDQQRLRELTAKAAQSPGDAALRCDAAEILLRTGREDQGLMWLASALQADPRQERARRVLADYYERSRDPAAGTLLAGFPPAR